MLLAFWGLNRIISKMAFPKEKRYLHLRMTFVLLVLELVFLNHYTSAPLIKGLDLLINTPFISKIFAFILPSRAYEVLYMLLIVLGLNLVAFIGSIAGMSIVKNLFGEKNLYFLEPEDYVGWKILFYIPHKIVNKFYDSSDSKIVLSEKGHCIGTWAKAMKRIFAILAIVEIVLLAVSVCWGNATWNILLRTLTKAWYWVPFAGFLVTEQIQFFLEGNIISETGTFGTTDISDALDGDISEMPRLYEATFKNTDSLVCYNKLNRIENNSNYLSNDLGNQLIDDCENSDVLNVLSRQLSECNVAQTEIYQKALACLADNHSINVCDKGEGEFLLYLTAYLNYVLSQGNTALILCKNRQEANKYSNIFTQSMQRLNNIGAIWKIRTSEDAKNDLPMNVLVCSFDDLLDSRVLEKRREFSAVLKCVVIISGEAFVTQDDIRIVRLFNEISLYTKELQYVLLTDTDNDNIRTAIENYIKQELLPFNNAVCLSNTHIMVWEEESCHKLQCTLGIGTDMSPHIGTALPLALVAAKYDFPKVNVIPSINRPDDTYYQALAVNTLDTAKYLSNNAVINTVIRQDKIEALNSQDLKVLVCYDEYYNLLGTSWEWTKYGGKKGSILHIISPFYLLREFFADKFTNDTLYVGNKEFDALVPHGGTMKTSSMIALLVDLRDKGLTEEDILKTSKENDWGYSSAEEVLDACLSVLLNNEEKYNIFEYFHFEQRKRQLKDQGGFVTETIVTLSDTEAYNRIMKRITRAVLQIGDDKRVELPILQKDISNYYLREQSLIYNGFLYKINAIKNETIFATQQSDCYIYDYYPVSKFSFDNYTITDKCVDGTYLDFNIATAEVTRDIYAYWRSNNGYRITDNSIFSIESLCDEVVHETKNANILEINLSKSVLGEDSERVANTLAFILNDMFKTLFPYTHKNLFAVVPIKQGQIDLSKTVKNGTNCDIDEIIQSLIPYTHKVKSSNSDFQTIYVVEFACVEYGMAKLVYDNHESILRIVREYLEWYLEPVNAENGEVAGTRGKYLSFASNKIPSAFALKELLAFLVKVTGESVAVSKAEQPVVEVELSKECSFCGRKTLFVHELNDTRLMCNSCYDHQVTQREEIKTLYMQTVDFLESGYAIEIRKNINVRFKSAREIAKELSGVTNGRALGFYRDFGHQLWLEARGPRVPMRGTMIHELTHCWQHDNLPLKELKKALPKDKRDELLIMLLEGHATYVEIETMKEMHETDYAMRQHQAFWQRDDEYGRGYRLIYDYFKEKAAEGSHMNVFTIMQTLATDIINGKVIIS